MCERDWPNERAIIAASANGREALIAGSFARLTGDALAPPGSDPAAALWGLPAVVLAHGTEGDPVFFYGNRVALELFEMAAADFVRLPSRLSAEPDGRARRAELMERVTREGFIRDYSGVRVSQNGRRFRIEQATVWNLIDEGGVMHGQAATFAGWTPIRD